MAIARNHRSTAAALQRLLTAVQRVERLRPLEVNIQRLYRIEDQVREALLEAMSVEGLSAYTAAAAPALPSDPPAYPYPTPDPEA